MVQADHDLIFRNPDPTTPRPTAPPPRPMLSTERQELLDEIQSLKNALRLRDLHINKLNELVELYRNKTDLLDESDT